jgi:diguanylate cyclase (GGDEF)-like protein
MENKTVLSSSPIDFEEFSSGKRTHIDRSIVELEERYRNSLDVIADGFAIFSSIRNSEGNIIDFSYQYINQSSCLSKRMPKDDLIGRSLLEISPTDQISSLFDQYVKVVETGLPYAQDSLVCEGTADDGLQDLTRVINLRVTKFGDGFSLTWRDVSDYQRKEEMLQKRNNELVLINSASKAFNSTLYLDQVLLRVLDILTPQLGEAASFWLVDRTSGELVCREASGPSAEMVRNWRLKPGEGIAGWVAQSGESLIIDDVLKDERFSSQVSQTTGFRHRSLISIPLKSNEKIIGVLQVLGIDIGRFQEANLALFESIASFAAIAVENARLFEESQKIARQTYLLNEITQAAISANDLESMGQVLADRLGELFHADNVFITFWDDTLHKAVPVASYNSFNNKINKYAQIRVEPDEKTLTNACLDSGEVIAIEDYPNTSLISERIKSQFSLRSIMGLPLISDGRKLGAVLLGYTDTHIFSQDEIALGERTAAQVALALQKVNLLDVISKLAITDDLTGLYNRRGFVLLADQYIKRACQAEKPILLFYIDLDDLKGINDRLGHQYGDSALIEAAGLIKRTFRSSDVIARVGGDEFCILMVNGLTPDARKIIKRFNNSIAKLNSRFSHPYKLSLSTGYACLDPKKPCLVEELMTKADAAMYKDKKKKRKRY